MKQILSVYHSLQYCVKHDIKGRGGGSELNVSMILGVHSSVWRFPRD